MIVNVNLTIVILWLCSRLDWSQRLSHEWRARDCYRTQEPRKLDKQYESYVTELPEARPVIDLVRAVLLILRLCRAPVKTVTGSATWKGLKKNEGITSDCWTARCSFKSYLIMAESLNYAPPNLRCSQHRNLLLLVFPSPSLNPRIIYRVRCQLLLPPAAGRPAFPTTSKYTREPRSTEALDTSAVSHPMRIINMANDEHQSKPTPNMESLQN
jgi:hypothetical protein